MLGDSLTAGYGVAEQDAFPARLRGGARSSRASTARCSNAGVSGDTSAGGVARLDWVLADKPTHLLVELGGNDALRGLPVDQLEPISTKSSARPQAAGSKSCWPACWRRPISAGTTLTAFKQVYIDLAAAHNDPLYPFLLDGAVLQTGLMQPDGSIPTREGSRSSSSGSRPMVVPCCKLTKRHEH